MKKVPLDRLGGVCFYCPAPATTRDHIIPEAQGGSNSQKNLVPACYKCNNERGNTEFVEFVTLKRGPHPGGYAQLLPRGETKIEQFKNSGAKFVINKNCKRCKKEFPAVTTKALYCGRNCKDRANKSRKAKK